MLNQCALLERAFKSTANDGSNYLPTCFNNSLNNMLSNVMTKSREVTLLGDTNVDYLKKNDNLAIKNFFHLYGFQQIVTKPTRITEYSKTLIEQSLQQMLPLYLLMT